MKPVGDYRAAWTARGVSRRQLLGGTAAITGAGALLAACGGSSSSSKPAASSVGLSTATRAATSPATPVAGSAGTPQAAAAAGAGQPRRGGSLIIPQTASLTDIFDPHTSAYVAAYIYQFVGNNTMRWSKDGSMLVPELVQSWEVLDNGAQVTLKVDPTAKWQNRPPIDGRAVDAADIAYNLMRISGKLAPPAEQAKYQRASNLAGMNRAEAVDNATVRVTFDKPSSSFFGGLTDHRMNMIPRDYLDKGGTFDDATKLVGSGPFFVQSYQNNQLAVFARNPEYWRPRLPYLDSVQYKWLPDASSMASAFAQGQVSVFQNPNKVQRETLSRLAKNAQEVKWFNGQWNHFRFNMAKKPFDDARVRKALGLVLDNSVHGNSYFGTGYWQYTAGLPAAFPEGLTQDELLKLPGWNPSTRDADIKTAKDLMTAAGYPDGAFSFKMMQDSPDQNSPTYDWSIRAIDQWKKVWAKIDPQMDPAIDAATFAKRSVQGDFDGQAYSLAPIPDAAAQAAQNFATTGSRNYGKFSDPQVDAMLDKAISQFDLAQRKATLQDFQRYLINGPAPIITAVSPANDVWWGEKWVVGDYGSVYAGGAINFIQFTERMWLKP